MRPITAPDLELAAPPGWPAGPGEDAYQGLAGQVVGAIAPHTEADPVAILAQLLVAGGVQVGRGAYVAVEATRHHPGEFVVLVGDSAKARKGSSWDHVARLMGRAASDFDARCRSGLSSGEGLVWALRDPTGADPGAPDQRLLVVEPEFASVLKMTSRDVSTLSPVLRNAWDGRPLAILTRSAPARCSRPHLGVIGHITAAELAHHANELEVANGLLNRFCFIACRRVRLLPEGGTVDPLGASGLIETLRCNLSQGAVAGEMRMSEEARAIWWDAYLALAEVPDGLLGSLCARSEAHVLRLSLLYALLDGAQEIGPEHLRAALALWGYSAASAAMVFGASSGDPLAESVHGALVASAAGMTRTEIRDFFGRNRSALAIDRALAALARHNRAACERVPTAGRPAELWHAIPPQP